LRGANPAEWLALRAGLVPAPAAEAWGGMGLSGILIAAVRTGLTAQLAQRPGTAAELAADLGLDPLPTRLLLDCLRSAGHVTVHDGRYRLSRRARRWLDPASGLSVAGYVAGTADYWTWWAELGEVTQGRRPAGTHGAPPGDPYWQRYIRGQYELARLSAAEVARKLRLPAGARHLLDVGGGHGLYSVQLCRRHPGLTATVLDLPGSAAVGREIVAAAGLADRVRFHDGDVTAGDLELGGSYDAVLCFNLVHHLPAAQITVLLGKARDALAPGGTLAVLDAFADPGGRASAAANFLGLFVYLSSGSHVHTPDELRGWLREAGFAAPRRVRVLRVPGLSLYVARKELARLPGRSGCSGRHPVVRWHDPGFRTNACLRLGPVHVTSGGVTRQPGLGLGRLGLGRPRLCWLGTGADDRVQHLRVGDGHDAAAGVQPHVGDPDLGDGPGQLPAERSGPEQDLVADLERPGQQQHHPREHVPQRLLRGDADEDAGQRAAEDKLADRDVEQGERDDQRGESADQQNEVPGDRGVRGPCPPFEHRAGLGRQPERGRAAEDAERHGADRGDDLHRHILGPEKRLEMAVCPTGHGGRGDREDERDDRLPRPGLLFHHPGHLGRQVGFRPI
jgi:2-polyprenyl-3-methyl-5-hydroxy-6-metoxy-1,4-benzoquinol methylase